MKFTPKPMRVTTYRSLRPSGERSDPGLGYQLSRTRPASSDRPGWCYGPGRGSGIRHTRWPRRDGDSSPWNRRRSGAGAGTSERREQAQQEPTVEPVAARQELAQDDGRPALRKYLGCHGDRTELAIAPHARMLGAARRSGKSILWSWRAPAALAWWAAKEDLTMPTMETRPIDCLALARELGPRFAARAAGHDADDTFVAENYEELRTHRVFSAGVPFELGGGGATYRELCEMLRLIAHSCSSTALALSMHTHILASTVWRWRHQGAPVEPFLRRVAAEELVLISTGGSDFLTGSGVAEKVEGGYRVTARKIFGSGSPGGHLLMTMAVYEDPKDGPIVLHFPVPMDAPGVKVCDNWRTLGMRGTGSNGERLRARRGGGRAAAARTLGARVPRDLLGRVPARVLGVSGRGGGCARPRGARGGASAGRRHHPAPGG